LDVLPDEASLAMLLARELSHIILEYRPNIQVSHYTGEFDGEYRADRRQETAADLKAKELLMNSRYKDKLTSTWLFLATLRAQASSLNSLIQPQLGNGLGPLLVGNVATISSQPQDIKTGQVVALPLGGRIDVDPFTDRIAFVPDFREIAPGAIRATLRNVPFEVVPFSPEIVQTITEEGTRETRKFQPPPTPQDR